MLIFFFLMNFHLFHACSEKRMELLSGCKQALKVAHEIVAGTAGLFYHVWLRFIFFKHSIFNNSFYLGILLNRAPAV